MALRDSYSPRNISSAALPSEDDFTKYCRSSSPSPSGDGTKARMAPVLVNPEPRPEVERLALEASVRLSARRMDVGTGGIMS